MFSIDWTIQGNLADLDVWISGKVCREFRRIPSIYRDDMVMFQCCLNCQNTRGACGTQYENLLAIFSGHSAVVTLKEEDVAVGWEKRASYLYKYQACQFGGL